MAFSMGMHGLSISGHRRGASAVVLPPSTADYVVTTDAEWDAVFANTTATLDGKIVEVSGSGILTRRSISNHAFTLGLTVRSANAASTIPSLRFAGTVANVNLVDLNYQMTGWPKTYPEIIYFDGGTFSGLVFDGGTMRHGYGATLVDLARTANYPEYTRVDNLATATTTSTAYAISWQDAAMTSGWFEFFNNGANNVYVATGGAGVVATAASTLAPAGVRTRIAGLNPTTDTHFAVLAAAGTSAVNARAEIGLYYYLANGFAASGAANLSDIIIKNMALTDLANGIKGIPPTSGSLVVMDNNLHRIYMDIIACAPKSTGSFRVLRNIAEVPFSRSGIAENLTGDAGDPHGDFTQMFSDGTGPISNVIIAGNISLSPASRTGVVSQGLFISDNNFNPSYRNLAAVANVLTGAAPNGISSGELVGASPYPVDGFYIYGTDMFNPLSITSTMAVRTYTDAAVQTYVGSSNIAGFLEDGPGVQVLEGTNNIVTTAAAATDYYPNIAAYAAATDRAGVESALTTVGGLGAGAGFAAHSNVIDWTTTNSEAIVKWNLLPSGIAWDALPNQAASTVVTLPLRRVLNRLAGQTVVPSAGTEWQSVAADGVTVIQAWTTASGTVDFGQNIQARITSSAAALGTVTAGLTINGFLTQVVITTADVLTNPFIMNGAWFSDTANVLANTSVLEFEIKCKIPTASTSNKYLFAQESGGGLWTDAAGKYQDSVEDSTLVTIAAGAPGVGPSVGVVHTINYKVDLPGRTMIITEDGAVVSNVALPANSGLFQTGRKLVLASSAVAGGTSVLMSDVQVEYFKVWTTVSGVRSLVQEISVAAKGSIANINAMTTPWAIHGTVL